MAQFKNYVVNYDLVVKATDGGGFSKVLNKITEAKAPLDSFTKSLNTFFSTLNKFKEGKGNMLNITPTIDLAKFDAQGKQLIARAESVAAQVSAILNGAFTGKPATSKSKPTGTQSKTSPITKQVKETMTRTAAEIQREIDGYKDKLVGSFGKRGSMKSTSKGYKKLVESMENDLARKALFTELRQKLAAAQKDLKAAQKSGGTLTKTVTKTITESVKEAGKKAAKTPAVKSAFDSVLQGMVAGKAIEVPVSVVANAKSIGSLNAAIGKLQAEVKPIVIPITVASSIDAGKAVKGTASGLQNAIAQSAGKAAKSATLKKPTAPVLKKLTENEQKEYKRLSEKLAPLYEKQTKYQNEIAAIQQRASENGAIIGGMSEKDTKRLARLKNDLLPKVQKKISNIEPKYTPLQTKEREYLASNEKATAKYKKQLEKYNKAVAKQPVGTVSPVATTSGKTGALSMDTKLVSTGQAAFGLHGHLAKMQQLAAAHPTNLDTRLLSTGQAGFDLRMHLAKMQQLAAANPIKLDTRLVPTGQAGYGLRMHIFKLQELAAANPIKLNTIVAPSATGVKPATGTKTVAPTTSATSAAKTATKAVTGKGTGALGPSLSIMPADILTRVFALKMLSETWNTLPKTGNRTFTVNLKTPGLENAAKLQQLIQILQSLPRSTSRTYTVNTNVGEKANRGTSQNTIIRTGGRSNATSYIGRPKGTMNTFGYQLMGNTSLGAKTPMFLDMMKGMGMMTGVGAAMSTLTNAFTNATEYQNTMLTAKSILQANYKGNNFESDFGHMTRIVRDVAKQTKFTAPQAADAARFMAMAGLDIPMINASIRPIADVAVIGDNDLGEVADKITNIQTAFKIKPQQMRSLADALTKTFTSSNTDMMMLAESMEYAAPMAHLAGAKVEDALAMIGIMGNAGIQGSMAGTTLRMMYQNVINPNKNQKLMWEKLGINLRDEKGNPRQLIEILGDLRKKVRITSEDKELDGAFKDEGTPIAEAVSKLFRVTASAGAGTLIENLDKVIKLAEENRNAQGLSESISLVKQNNVKGMWAKMTSAFTDAVVNEFESNESPIKGYLSNITKYFGTSEFQELLHDLFDLVSSMMNMLGKFVQIWRKLYKMFGGAMKYVWMLQFIMAQIGYTLAPIRGVYQTFAKGIGAAGLMMGGAGMSGGAMAANGVGYAAAGSSLLGAKSTPAFMSSASVVAARKNMMSADRTLLNSRKYLAAASMSHAATTPALERSIAKKQMQWLVASNLVGSAASLRSSDNRAARWSLAFHNPQAASELPNRFKIMAKREKEIAALQAQVAARNRNIALANAAVDANLIASQNKHRAYNAAIGNARRATRKVSADVLNRAAQMGKISKGRAIGMSLSSGFRTAATWAPTITMASIMGGFTKTVGFIGKILGTLANPITALTLAFAGLLATVIAIGNRRKKEQEEFKKQDKILKGDRDIAKGQLTSNVLEERSRLGYGVMKLGKIDNNFSLSSIGVTNTLPDGTKLAKNPLMRNLKGVSEIFRGEGKSGYFNSALEHMSAFSRLMFGEEMNQRQIWERFGYTVEDSVNSARPTKEFTKSAAIAAVMEASSHYVYADKLMQPIQRRLEEWTKIKDVKAAEEEWSKILADAKILAEQYNPKNKNLPSLQNYTSEQIGDMPFSQAFNTYEGQLALYDKLKSVEDPDHPLFGYFHALRKLRSDTQMNAQEIIDTVFKVSGGVQYELPDMNGQLKTVNQAFNEGKLKWEDFQANIQAFGLNVKDTLGAYHQIIYKTFLETRKIALEAGQVPPELEAFLKENGANIPQWYINTADDEELKKWRNDVRNRYTYDEKFRNEVDQQGGIEEFLDKNFGKTWFGKQRRPSTDLINGTVNSAIIRQNELSNQGNQGTTPPPVKPDKSKTSWGKWGNMMMGGQQSYMNSYGGQSNNTGNLYSYNNRIEIKIDGRNVEDERLAALVGNKIVETLGAMANNNKV